MVARAARSHFVECLAAELGRYAEVDVTEFVIDGVEGVSRMKYLLLFGMAALGASCTSPVGPSVGLRVETSAEVFVIPARGESVAVRFVTGNLGEKPVYVARCGDRVMAAVERWEATEWVQFSGDGCYAVYNMALLAISAGERREDTRSIRERGVYRLRLGSAPEANQQPGWNLVSNVFEIR